MTAGAALSIAVLLGLIFGSFATALSFRLPRGVPIFSTERSQCPSCGHVLSVLDLVPILSWLFLLGRCRHCRRPIGTRYPIIELSTLILCLVIASVYGVSATTAPLFAITPILVSMFDIDLRYRIIPDSLNLALLIAGVLALVLNAAFAPQPATFFIQAGSAALSGVVIYGGGSLLLRAIGMAVMKREPLGFGDVKFYAAAGFWLGMSADAAVLFLIVSGLLGVVFTLLWKKRTGQAEAPFAPPLILAFFTALCVYPTGLVLF